MWGFKFSSDFPLKKKKSSHVPVTHACNPSYSGRDREDHSSKPAWENSSQDPISEKKPKKQNNP
jgi:hypothetical protein